MVKIPQGVTSLGSAREMCVRKFAEWWTPDDMRNIMSKLDPGAGGILKSNGITSPDSLAGFLYDMVGPRFLRDIDDDRAKRRIFLRAILTTVTERGLVRETDIVETAADMARNGRIRDIQDVVGADMTARLCGGLAHELGLPPSVARKERVQTPPQTEIVEPHTPLNPLYDYQYSTGKVVRDILEGKYKDGQGREVMRRLIAVPTGSGKTRMIVQTLVEWLNAGKPSKYPQRRNSKFILWVAQSGELCEQALSSFRSVFESVGRRGTTLHLHRFWGPGGALPKIGMEDMLDERGVIVATIQSLHKVLTGQPRLLEKLGRLTSCIVVDEAHHSVTTSYSSVLRRMGFNWDNRKAEISELGIVLIGLTATPFRGSGDSLETQRLRRRYGSFHFPAIPHIKDSTNYRPHALIDCQTSALAGREVHILGERSYDRDGFIHDTDYFWNIRRLGPGGSAGGDAAGQRDRPDWARRDEWTHQGVKNVSFKFEQPGTYEITLRVVDNEGDPGEASTRIEILEPGGEDEGSESERQKLLYRSLVNRKVLCEVYHYVLSTAGTVDLDEKDEKHLETFGEFRGEKLKSIGESRERNDAILREIVRLKKVRKKILFFGCSVEHSRRIALYLKMQGVKARYVDSKMGADSRAEAIEEFRNSDLEILCNFGVLTTGFDAPNIDCVFVGRPVKSTLLYTQMIGRGMRGTKSGGTDNVLVVDMDDNFQMRDRSTVELGWKIFEPYWKRWEEMDGAWSRTAAPGKESGQDISEQSASRPGARSWMDGRGVSEPAATPDWERTCSSCGVRATGTEDIAEKFGIASPPEVLAEFLKDGRFDELPPECYMCRTGGRSGPAAPGGGSGGPAGDGAAHSGESGTAIVARREPEARRADAASQDLVARPRARPAPTSERMLLDRFDIIISKGRKSNTYKFALAACLVHHASGKDPEYTVKYTDIAAAFLECYWHQVVKYGIRQNPQGHHPPRVVRAIRKAFRGCRGELADMPPETVRRAVSEILRGIFGTAKSKTSLVVPRFQVIDVGGTFVEEKVFYEYSDAGKTLTLRPEALAFFRKNRVALLRRIFVEWARFLERVNAPAGPTAYVRNNLERWGAFVGDAAPGEEPGSARCLACGAEMGRGGVRLYRLMPWSYVFESEGWPRVPLCAVCHDKGWEGQEGWRLIECLVDESQKDYPNTRAEPVPQHNGYGPQDT